MLPEKPYYSPEEVAEYYDVSAETIRRMCRDKQIPGAIQIGRQWRIPREYVLRNRTIQQPDEDTKDH